MSMDAQTEAARRRADWMAQVQRGDRVAYRALLDDIGPALEQFVRRRLRDVEDVKDAYQEILMALHRARHTYEPERPFEPWFFAIARRVLARGYQQRVLRDTRETLVHTLPERGSDGDGSLKLELEDALAALSADQREAFALVKVDGLSIEDAAARAGTTVGALKVRAHRAYRTLRRLL